MVQQKEQSTRLGTEPIPQLLKSLSIPAIIGMLVMSLYNIVDTIFISYAVGIDGVAAVTIAFPVMIIMMALAAALGMGGSSVISRRLGEKREAEANRVFSNIISLVVVLGLLGAAASFTLLEPVLTIFGATENIIGLAHDYIFPITLATIFFTFSFTTNAIIRSEGNARFAMVTMIIPSVLNIILDPIFIIWLDMGVQGASVATVISQASVSFVVLYYFLAGRSSLFIRLSEMMPELKIVKEVFIVGLPAFVRQVAGSVMMVAINAMLIQYGGEFYVGVFGIVQRIAMITLMPMMGILQGMQPIVGYNYGAQDFARMQEAIKLSLKVVTGFSIGVFLLVMLIPQWLMTVFTSDPEVIEAGVYAMRIIFAAAFVIGVQVISGGLYQALGKAKPALILSMARQVLFLIPLVLILPQFIGVWGVWIAFPAADILAFALSLYFLYKDRNLFFKGGNTIHRPEEVVRTGT
ncbi:MATE family efflux transporter [Alkalicoccus daliensis]|uniref:Multidrug export protein MepA n=1 Tax=Alkalicoccus daliensis TaxID=745820 RepID=A0A1H0IQ52_9BACI|nr:MATE family efflux transporter [Alkalicoccus daliensis]SDO33151.1 putative efflux protein, MATE family [Alkalicoccus daliensis]